MILLTSHNPMVRMSQGGIYLFQQNKESRLPKRSKTGFQTKPKLFQIFQLTTIIVCHEHLVLTMKIRKNGNLLHMDFYIRCPKRIKRSF